MASGIWTERVMKRDRNKNQEDKFKELKHYSQDDSTFLYAQQIQK